MSWERALEADARLAAKNSVLIRAALRQSIDFEAAYRGYQSTTPDTTLSLPQQRTRARAWAIINIRVNLESLKEVLYRVWAEAYALGDLAAQEQIALAREAQKDVQVGVDWSKWKPGDAASAIILKPPRAFQQLLQNQGITFKNFSDTNLRDLGNAIGEAIELGLDARTAAKRIARHVASPARALSIAITEQNRAISQATKERYLQNGLRKMTWLVFDPCKICAQNANKQVIINQPFPSNHIQPPAHPNCRCALSPVIAGYNDQELVPGANIVTPPPTPVEVVTEVVEQVKPIIASTTFAPGQWRTISKEEIRQNVIDVYAANNPTKSREIITEFVDKGLIGKADKALIDKGIVYQNGPIRVEFYSAGATVSNLAKEKLLKEIDALQTFNPKEKMTVIVASNKGDFYGSAILGDAKIWLKPKVVMEDTPLKRELGFKMPSIGEVPHSNYTLAHEWGHTLDIGGSFTRTKSTQEAGTSLKIARLRNQFKDNPLAFVSEYANKNSKEFYAEMFAEFYSTKGQTDNPLVLAMAKEFGWKKPNVSRSGPAFGTPESDAIKPIKANEYSHSIERNKEIEDEIKEIRTYLPKDASDDRLIDALALRGSQGEIDNTDIYWPLVKKYQAQGMGLTDAKNQANGTLLRARYYLENKKEIELVEERLKGYIAEGYSEDATNFRQKVETAKGIIKNAMAEGKVTVAISLPSLKEVVAAGRFKNQFETGTSGGLKNTTTRKIGEKAALDVDLETKSKDRPIYGYITTNTGKVKSFEERANDINVAWQGILSIFNDSTNQYGLIKVVLKDSVRARTTVTIGDSLRTGVLADSINGTAPDLVQMGLYRYGAPTHMGGMPASSYLEAQITGGVKLEDIDTIYVQVKDGPYEAVKELIDKTGLDIKVVAVGE